MNLSRRLFLRHTATVGAVAATASVPEAQAEPETTPLEKVKWHMREIESLISKDGGKRTTVLAVADYGDDSGYRGSRGMGLSEGHFRNADGMFAPKGGEA
jgi:hypothetical protein